MDIKIRVFDTVLDSRNIIDTVSRNSADFWKPFCKSAGWSFSYERVHSLKDLEYFFSKKIKENVIIFSGHGAEKGFFLTNGECFDSNSSIRFPVKNYSKIIIFSTCLLGKHENLLSGFEKYFSAQAVFSYRHVMFDRFCFLNESVLLTLIEDTIKKGGCFGQEEFKKFQEKTKFMKNMNVKYVREHPMMMSDGSIIRNHKTRRRTSSKQPKTQSKNSNQNLPEF